MSVGISSVAVIGHSSGEIAAAYASLPSKNPFTNDAKLLRWSNFPRISVENCILPRLFYVLISTTSGDRGAMLSVGLSTEELMPFLSKINKEAARFDIDMCCFNSLRSVTVSGPESQIDVLKSMLEKECIFAHKLQVSVAYHSKQMNEVASEYLSLLGGLSTDGRSRSVPMIYSVTGARIDPKELRRSEYWVENIVSPVLFTEAMRSLCSSTRRVLTKKIDGSHRSAIFVDHLIKIGQHAALQSAIRECSKQCYHSKDIIYSTILRRNNSASKTFLDLVGRLHALGYKIDLRRVNDPFVESGEFE